jgi:hypothetical protein
MLSEVYGHARCGADIKLPLTKRTLSPFLWRGQSHPVDFPPTHFVRKRSRLTSGKSSGMAADQLN